MTDNNDPSPIVVAGAGTASGTNGRTQPGTPVSLTPGVPPAPGFDRPAPPSIAVVGPDPRPSTNVVTVAPGTYISLSARAADGGLRADSWEWRSRDRSTFAPIPADSMGPRQDAPDGKTSQVTVLL